MALKFIEVNTGINGSSPEIYAVPALTFAILIGPIFDTIRVFILRISNGVSPFMADRNHIHHRMLKLGLSHLQTTFILTTINIACIGMVLLFRNYGNSILIILMVVIYFVFNLMVLFLLRSKARESLSTSNLIFKKLNS